MTNTGWASAEVEWDGLIYKYVTSLARAPEFEQVYLFDAEYNQAGAQTAHPR